MWFDNSDVPWYKPIAIAALVAIPAHRHIAEQPTVEVKSPTTQATPTTPAVAKAVDQRTGNGTFPVIQETFPAITD